MSEVVMSRTPSDCGVAALATANGWTWEQAFAWLAGAGDWPESSDYLGVTREKMRDACGGRERERGVPPTAPGARGLALCSVDGTWQDGTHWAAFEVDAQGVCWLLNPTDSERFRLMHAHSRRLRVRVFIVTKWNSREVAGGT